MTLCPATVSVALRASPVFSAIVTLTVPLPVWLVDEVIVTNEEFDDAVHAQLLPALTVNDAEPPVPAMLSDVLERVYVHVGVGDTGLDVETRYFEHAAIPNRAVMMAASESVRIHRA